MPVEDMTEMNTPQMTHMERVTAVLEGREVDRPPVSMWRHFFASESTAEGLAAAMLGFQDRFDWDFMKVNPRASYHVEDWGVKVRYSGDYRPEVVETPVKQPEDWLKLNPLDTERGALGEQLKALELISTGLHGSIPFLMTVFTPLSIAGRLVESEEVFLQHLREHPDMVSTALEAIAETFVRFCAACLDRGASGLFLATTSWATSDRLGEEEYARSARPLDLRLLQSAKEARFNMVHVCRERSFLGSLADYPAHAFNWDARGAGNPPLCQGGNLMSGKAVVGGLGHGRRLVTASPQELAGEVVGLRVAMGRTGWMLGPGCTFDPVTPEVNLLAIREAADMPLT